MTPIQGGSIGISLLLCLTVGAWLLHPKGADTPLAQSLPNASAGTGPIHWVVLGSSLSTGSWPHATAARLSDCLRRHVNVQQITGPGRGSDWGLEQIDTLRQTAPDLVTIEFTINDSDVRRGVSLAQSRANHLAMISALPDIPVVLLRLSRAHGLRAALRPFQARYDDQLVGVAAQTDAGLIDLRPLWAKAPATDLPDGLHPTDAAAATRTAPALATALAPLFDKQGC